MITIPKAICWAYVETCNRLSPLFKTAITIAPIIVPDTVPLPPFMEAPPITTEATAFNSYPVPASGNAESTRPICTIPPSAAIKPQIVYTIMIVLSILIPESFAASAFPPIA